MEIEIRSQTIDLTPELRANLSKRAQFAFDRFRDRIGRVVLSLTDTNGPKGGVSNECSVSVDLRGRGHVFVREADADAAIAGTRALERAGHAVARELEKRMTRETLRHAAPREAAS